ncbi:MAG: mannose-1-phosphate guanylyltransferase/mannose-6-phosphate isomerase [Alteromonadaceae bacterium]|nr:mannose-1-phosphate guanylyltransferase/mannose-6-phosphate isomerase [Alteromonadaceae bacterium]
MIHPVVMAGGTGSRLWPLSRQLNPKQFLKLTDDRLSMLQLTLARLEGVDSADPLLICNEEHRFLAAEQMRQSGYHNARIILEPCGRNTAPAIALAALQLLKTAGNDEDPLMLVLAADHLIQNAPAFREGIASAIPLAEDSRLVTFGIVPGHAETGYGYIQKGGELTASSFEVNRFVEKPDQKTAESYLSSGDYLWNSGMFLFGARTYLDELQKHRPDILAICHAAMEDANEDLHFTRVNENVFADCPEDSIDYAVMEKTSNAAVISLDAGWSDIGSWSTLWEVSDKDENGNSFTGDVIAHNTDNTLVRAESRLVATVGVKDLVIVETKDALLVAHKDDVQDVKKVVNAIKNDGRHEHMNHREVYRPWGVYDSIDNGDRYQVKRITVKPGAKLSVQMHHHRAEHWIVVSGTAKVTNGENTYLVTENQSTYIPIGQVHSLENPGVIDLELVEVQSGSYLGEDDIVRFEDRYGRS